MLDDILEFAADIIFDIVLEGAIDGVVSKKVPMVLRVILGVIVASLYIAIIGLLLYVGIKEDSVLFTLLAAFVAIGSCRMVVKKYNETRTEE